MAEVSGDWSTNSNEAVNISLVIPSDSTSKAISTFHPRFTYSIFNDEESIFGYQGLKIHLKYHACDMRPGLQITYTKKFKAIGETKPTDIREFLEKFLPATAFEKSSIFDASINSGYVDWKPPGEHVQTITTPDATYEIWMGNLSDIPIQQLVKRLQILVSFFIEGGVPINLDDAEWSLQRWTVFLLYKKSSVDQLSVSSPYVFMGYCTVYKYFPLQAPTSSDSPSNGKSRPKVDFELPLPESTASILPCRSRISQFIILPPFQGGGNGARFYEKIFTHYLNDQQTIEITVEDPNEAFDDLRDLNDLIRLRQIPEFTSLRINTDVLIRSKGTVPAGKIVDRTARDILKRKTKIAPRQFSRVVEMQLLSLIPSSIRKSLIPDKQKPTAPEMKLREHEYHLWQLFVKQRLYRHNRDSLIQLDRLERIDKLEEALDSVEVDYARLLRKLESKPAGSGGSNGKRLAEDIDGAEPDSKRVRVDDK